MPKLKDTITVKKKQRADDQIVVSFSCPKYLKAALTNAAKNEKRSLSNFLCYYLEDMLDSERFANTPILKKSALAQGADLQKKSK